MRHYQVITVGEATIDSFMTLKKTHPECRIDSQTGDICFRHGEKIDVDRYDFCIGGNATNVCVGLSRLGIHATLCTEIGDDEFSLKIHNELAKENIDRLFVTQTKNSFSNFSFVINFKGDRTIFVKNLDREHNFVLNDVATDYIYLTSLGNEWKKPYNDVLDYIEKNGTKLAFNPGSLQLYDGQEMVHKVMKKTDILFLNKEEAERVLFHKNEDNSPDEHDYIKELLVKLKKIGPKLVIITNGKHGSFALDEGGNFHYHHTTPGAIIERTGAGDAFTAGFLASLIHGHDVQKTVISV